MIHKEFKRRCDLELVKSPPFTMPWLNSPIDGSLLAFKSNAFTYAIKVIVSPPKSEGKDQKK